MSKCSYQQQRNTTPLLEPSPLQSPSRTSNAWEHPAFVHRILSYIGDGETKKRLRLVSRHLLFLTTHWSVFNLSWFHWTNHLAHDQEQYSPFQMKKGVDFIVAIMEHYNHIYGLTIDENIIDAVNDALQNNHRIYSLRYLCILGPWRTYDPWRTSPNLEPYSLAAKISAMSVLQKFSVLETLHIHRMNLPFLDLSGLSNLANLHFYECFVEQAILPANVNGSCIIRHGGKMIEGTWSKTFITPLHRTQLQTLQQLSKLLGNMPLELMAKIFIKSISISSISISEDLRLDLLMSLKRITIGHVNPEKGTNPIVAIGSGPYDAIHLGSSECHFRMTKDVQCREFMILSEPVHSTEAYFDIMRLSLSSRLSYERSIVKPDTALDFDNDVKLMAQGCSFLLMVHRRQSYHLGIVEVQKANEAIQLHI